MFIFLTRSAGRLAGLLVIWFTARLLVRALTHLRAEVRAARSGERTMTVQEYYRAKLRAHRATRKHARTEQKEVIHELREEDWIVTPL